VWIIVGLTAIIGIALGYTQHILTVVICGIVAIIKVRELRKSIAI